MGFGHSHSHKKKKNIRRRVTSATKEAQHDLAHAEGHEHHEALGHEWLPGKHHHAEHGQPYPDLPSSHHPHPEHPEGYPWAPVEHADYGKVGPGSAGASASGGLRSRRCARARGRSIREEELGAKGWKEEVDRCLEYGLEAAPSVKDRTISTFARGELPHFAGINTFCKIALPRRCEEGFAVRCGGDWRAVRHRHDLSQRHAIRPARHPPHLGALRHLQLRTGRGSARIAQVVRCRRRVHHREHRERVRPDLESCRACAFERRVSDHARRRSLDRLPERARHRAVTSTARSASFISTATWIRRRPTWTNGCTRLSVVSRDEHPQRAARKSRAARHRRLAGAASRREGRTLARHHGAHHRRHLR